MTKITDKPEIDALADGDLLYVRDLSDPMNPDKKAPFSKLRPGGARITANRRFSGEVNIPTLAAGAIGESTITISDTDVGDHAVLNVVLPANVGVIGCWVSAANTLRVRFRNFHSADVFPTAQAACVALVSRSVAG